MDTHYNIHARACGCAYRCIDGKRKGKEWERKRITAAAKNIRTFFKKTGIFLEKTIIFLLKTVIFLENGLILFRKDKNVRAGEERAFHIHIRRIPCTPGRFTKHLQQSFAKLLPLLPPTPLKPRWTGPLKGWWHHLFLRGKKGCCHHFHLFFTPERPLEGEDTGGGGGPNTGKRRRVRTDRTTVAYRQSHSCNPAELWLHLDGTEVTAGRN